MSAAQITRLKDRYAHARESRQGIGQAYERLRAAVNDALAEEVRLRKQFADLKAAQDRVHRDCKTLRETFGTGAPR